MTTLKICLTLLVLMAAVIAKSQQVTLYGEVIVHNSRFSTGQIQYVSGAGVSAANAGSTITDDSGKFVLHFVGKEVGTPVSIQVEKRGYVVVNSRDFQAIMLGDQNPIRISLADSAKFEREQADLYDITFRSLTAQRDALIQRLRADTATSRSALAELQERFNQEFEHRWAAEDYLNTQLEEAKQRLPERVAELARVNLDDVSEIYRRAYAYLLEGKTDSVNALLDDFENQKRWVDSLAHQYATAATNSSNERDSIELSAMQVVEAYRLKAEAYVLRYEFGKAAAVYEKASILLLKVKRGRKDLDVANLFQEMGRLYYTLSKYDQAMQLQKDVLSILPQYLSVQDSLFATANSDLARTQSSLGFYEEAIASQLAAVTNHEALNSPIRDAHLIEDYEDLSKIQFQAHDYTGAINSIREEIAILERSMQDISRLVAAYNNLAAAYFTNGKLTEALAAQRKAFSTYHNMGAFLQIDKTASMNFQLIVPESRTLSPESKGNPYHEGPPLRGIGDLPVYYQDANLVKNPFQNYSSTDSSMQAQVLLDQISLLTAENDPMLPLLADSYHNLAKIFAASGKFQEAVASMRMSMHAMEGYLPNDHPKFASMLTELAELNKANGDLDTAASDYRNAIEINRHAFGNEHLKVGQLSQVLGTTFLQEGELDSAYKYLDEALEIFNQTAPGTCSETKNTQFSLSMIHQTWADRHWRAGHYYEALKGYLEVSRLAPDDSTVHRSIRMTTQVISNYGSLDSLVAQRTSSEIPFVVEYHLNLGLGYLKIGDFAKAKAHFTQLQQAFPSNPLLHLAWARYYALTHEERKAVSCLERAFVAGFDTWKLIESDPDFESIWLNPRFVELRNRKNNQ